MIRTSKNLFISLVNIGLIDQTLIKYILVGLFNTVIGMGSTLISFHLLGFSYSIAYTIGTVLGIVSSFTLNKHFTFKSPHNWKKEAIKFLLVSLIAYLVSVACLTYLIEWFKLPHDISFFASMVCYTLISYCLNKKVVFAQALK